LRTLEHRQLDAVHLRPLDGCQAKPAAAVLSGFPQFGAGGAQVGIDGGGDAPLRVLAGTTLGEARPSRNLTNRASSAESIAPSSSNSRSADQSGLPSTC